MLRSVAVLVGGTVLAQGLVILASPLMTRLYDPQDFGVVTMYGSLLTILTVLVTGRYEMALPLPEDDRSAANLVGVSLLLLAVTSLASFVGVGVFGEQIAAWLNAPGFQPYLWWLPVSLLGAGIYQVFNYWAIRKKAFGRIARTKMSQSIGQVSVQATLGLLHHGPLGLVLGDVIGRVGGATTFVTQAWREDREILEKVSVRDMIQVAGRYVRFPLITSWSGLLNSASMQVPILVMGSLFDNAVVGWFGLSYRVLQTPMTFVGQAVSQVFFSHASEARRQGNLRRASWEAFRHLVSLGMAPIMLIGISAVPVFGFVFGEGWETAGVYAQWLSPWLFLVFVASPLSSLTLVLEHQQVELAFQGTILVGRVLAIYAGWRLGSPAISIGLFCAISALLWFIYMLWLVKASGNMLSEALLFLVRELAMAVLVVLPVLAARVLDISLPAFLGTCVVSGLLVVWRAMTRLRRGRVA
ncbi:MAG: lipopolysaccharide biosynthesis protein [Bacillota bacterium]